MNRRNFLNAILKAGAACAILPAATTYVRTWSGLLVPEPRVFAWELITYDTVTGTVRTRQSFTYPPVEPFVTNQNDFIRLVSYQVKNSKNWKVEMGEFVAWEKSEA